MCPEIDCLACIQDGTVDFDELGATGAELETLDAKRSALMKHTVNDHAHKHTELVDIIDQDLKT